MRKRSFEERAQRLRELFLEAKVKDVDILKEKISAIVSLYLRAEQANQEIERFVFPAALKDMAEKVKNCLYEIEDNESEISAFESLVHVLKTYQIKLPKEELQALETWTTTLLPAAIHLVGRNNGGFSTLTISNITSVDVLLKQLDRTKNTYQNFKIEHVVVDTENPQSSFYEDWQKLYADEIKFDELSKMLQKQDVATAYLLARKQISLPKTELDALLERPELVKLTQFLADTPKLELDFDPVLYAQPEKYFGRKIQQIAPGERLYRVREALWAQTQNTDKRTVVLGAMRGGLYMEFTFVVDFSLVAPDTITDAVIKLWDEKLTWIARQVDAITVVKTRAIERVDYFPTVMTKLQKFSEAKKRFFEILQKPQVGKFIAYNRQHIVEKIIDFEYNDLFYPINLEDQFVKLDMRKVAGIIFRPEIQEKNKGKDAYKDAIEKELKAIENFLTLCGASPQHNTQNMLELHGWNQNKAAGVFTITSQDFKHSEMFAVSSKDSFLKVLEFVHNYQHAVGSISFSLKNPPLIGPAAADKP